MKEEKQTHFVDDMLLQPEESPGMDMNIRSISRRYMLSPLNAIRTMMAVLAQRGNGGCTARSRRWGE
jgi:hypothetical protein